MGPKTSNQLRNFVPTMKVAGKFLSVTTQVKAIEHFHVVLFIMLYKVVVFFKSVDETLVYDHSNESYWAVLSCVHVVLFIMLYKVVLTFKSVDETLVCDHSNESYRAILSCFPNILNTSYKNSLPELSYQGPCHLQGLRQCSPNSVGTRNVLHLADSPVDNGWWWLEPNEKFRKQIFIIWLAPWTGKMNRLLCCDWLPKRAWSITRTSLVNNPYLFFSPSSQRSGILNPWI